MNKSFYGVKQDVSYRIKLLRTRFNNNYKWYDDKDLFKKLAKETNYDNGYGAVEIAEDLIIEGKGFRMIRGEYDGSEWWDYILLENFIGNEELKDIRVLSVENSNKILGNNYIGWKSLKMLNENNNKNN